ncbi:MAG: glycosyltransferase [Ruegeria sp.]|uniref:glycosyltransferase n=1 Tax=Ruegeria sp. TaxID=1879320 RepID=UPI00349ED09B
MTAHTHNPLRILHGIPSLDLRHGGPSQSVAGLVSGLSALDQAPAKVAVMCRPDPNEPQLSSLAARHPVEFLHDRHWLPCAESFRRITRAVAGADIVHVHSYWNAFAATLLHAARRAGKPVVLSPRGCLHKEAIAYSSPLTKRLFGTLVGHRQLAGIAGFHFQSAEEAQHSLTGHGSAPALVVDNGVEIPDARMTPDEARAVTFGAGPAQLNLLFLGRLNRIKGIDLQLRALQHLRVFGLDAVLHLVGPDGGDLARLRTLACDLGMAPHLHVHGPVFDTRKHLLLRGADAVLMSSEFENNSNTALEAMAAGGVLIATQGSVPVSAVRAGAAVCTERSAQALAVAVGAMTRPQAQTQRARAVAYVQAHHGWPSRAQRMLDFYRSLL